MTDFSTIDTKFRMNTLFDLNHEQLRQKEHAERIYNAVNNKEKSDEIVKLGKVEINKSYLQIGAVFPRVYLLIDTNQDNISEFKSTIAKLKLAYWESPSGFIGRSLGLYLGGIPYFHPIYALLDDNLGIVKYDYSSLPTVKHFLSYKEMLDLGGNIRMYGGLDFDGNGYWSEYGETASCLDKVINEELLPDLAKVFDNVPECVCGVDDTSYATPITFDEKIPISSVPLVHPEKLVVKPKFQKEFEGYKFEYEHEPRFKAFRIQRP